MRALLLSLIVSTASAAIIDSIAVSVGNQAITSTAIIREIRLSSLQNGVPPDVSDNSRRKAVDRLIEQSLVRREMSFGNYPKVDPARVDALYAATAKARGGEAVLAQELAGYGLTKADLRSYFEWQLALLEFIELRFRPAVQVTREDVDKYVNKTNESQRLEIEQRLTTERADKQLDQWLDEQRTHTTIRFFDASLGSSSVSKPRDRATTHGH